PRDKRRDLLLNYALAIPRRLSGHLINWGRSTLAPAPTRRALLRSPHKQNGGSMSDPYRSRPCSRAEFASRFGSPDFANALCGYTREADTQAVLALLVHARPRRVLEVGTALGHMTANLTRWTLDDASIFTIDSVSGMTRAAAGAAEQQVEMPSRA